MQLNDILILLVLIPSCSLSWAASHHPQDFLRSIANQPDEGRQIITHYCAQCHAEKPIISIGAPRIGHSEDWKIRRQAGWRALFLHTDQGLRAMPPRGGCFECSDQQLVKAIQIMLMDKSKTTGQSRVPTAETPTT